MWDGWPYTVVYIPGFDQDDNFWSLWLFWCFFWCGDLYLPRQHLHIFYWQAPDIQVRLLLRDAIGIDSPAAQTKRLLFKSWVQWFSTPCRLQMLRLMPTGCASGHSGELYACHPSLWECRCLRSVSCSSLARLAPDVAWVTWVFSVSVFFLFS